MGPSKCHGQFLNCVQVIEKPEAELIDVVYNINATTLKWTVDTLVFTQLNRLCSLILNDLVDWKCGLCYIIDLLNLYAIFERQRNPTERESEWERERTHALIAFLLIALVDIFWRWRPFSATILILFFDN